MVRGWWLEKEGETSIFRAKRRNRWLMPFDCASAKLEAPVGTPLF